MLFVMKIAKLKDLDEKTMTINCCVIVHLVKFFLLWPSSAAFDVQRDLLSEAAAVQISPNDTWACCSTSGNCGQSSSSSLATPWCAFDGNSSTRWRLNPGQLKTTITVNLTAPSLVDRFEVNFDAQSVIPSSAVVSLLGSDVMWTTYVNQSCQPNNNYWRRQGSIYYSCTPASRTWNISVPKGLFSIRNGSGGWLWWRTFHQFQLTIDATDTDYNMTNGSGFIEFTDIRLYGRNQPVNGCNCHPVGVNDTNAPCYANGTCICQQTQSISDQCVPRLNQVLPNYGPSSGGTRVFVTGNYLSSVSEVKIGKANCSFIKINESLIQVRTTNGSEGSSLPIQLFWEKPEGVRSSVIVDGDFNYKPDPVVYNITPRVSISRGGIPQTVIGRNLDSVAFPFITIVVVTGSNVLQYNYTNKNFGKDYKDMFCQVVNSTMLICRTPDLDDIYYSSDSRACIRIFLDIDRPNDYTRCDAANEKEYGFKLTNNPEIYKWQDKPLKYPLYSARQVIEINGQNFLGGSRLEDNQITVGGLNCQIVGLVSNVVTFYPPNASLLDTNEIHEAIFSVGYYSASVGYLQYVTEDVAKRNAIIGGVIGGVGGIIVLVFIIVGIVLLRRRCHKSPHNVPPESKIRSPGYQHNILHYLKQEDRTRVEKCMVPCERIRLGKQLGKGNFGKVFQGTIINQAGVCEQVAIKTLIGDHPVSNKDKVEFLLEAMLMADFCHKHVLSLIAIVIRQDIPYVVLPLMDLGDLKNYVSNHKDSLVVGDLVSFSLQVAEGMEYLAGLKFVHRDLAARNCMINKDFLVKVADFGLARDIFEKDYYRPQDKQRLLPFKWMAPECLPSTTDFTEKSEVAFSEKSDVWSYGVLVWELMTCGKRPYNDINAQDLLRFLKEGRRLEKPPSTPDFIYGLMMRCWRWNGDERPQFKDIVRELKEILSLAAGRSASVSSMTATPASSSGNQEMNVNNYANNSYLYLLSNPPE